MDMLDCGHPASPARMRICRHLLIEEPDDLDRVWVLSGDGLDYDVCCETCDATDREPELVRVCEGCFERANVEYGVVAVRGEAGLTERPEPFAPELIRTPLPVVPLDVAAVSDIPGEWLLLTRNRVLRWNAGTGRIIYQRSFREPKPGVDRPWGNREPRLRLHVSPDGRFAAVVMDYGRHGLVLDLELDRTTMRLDRQSYYHTRTTPFPLAFDRLDSDLVVVHGTDWNRLDLSDPSTGQLLTPRSTIWSHGEERPEHYPDYFHGALHRSPGGRWIADDGWVWAPAGRPVVWDLRQWRRHNVWESDDGPSRRRLCSRDSHWDSPMCWIDEGKLVISGIGGDDLALIPGVRIFDPSTGDETHRFPGPAGALFSDGKWLYSSGSDGLSRWDPLTGDRTGLVPGFSPTHHHPGSRELVGVHDGALVRARVG